MRKCLKPTCNNARSAVQVFCGTCWGAIPKQVRDDYYATKPHSDERRAALLELMRAEL